MKIIEGSATEIGKQTSITCVCTHNLLVFKSLPQNMIKIYWYPIADFVFLLLANAKFFYCRFEEVTIFVLLTLSGLGFLPT